MPLPDYQSLMLPLLRQVADGQERVRDCVSGLADEFGLDEEERNRTTGDGRKTLLYDRAQWARTYLVKAGLLESPRRGFVRLSDEGRRVLDTSPHRIDNKFLERYSSFRQWIEESRSKRLASRSKVSEIPVDEEISTPRERIDEAAREIIRTVSDDILDRLRDGSSNFFERAVVDLLVAMGYGGGRDGAGQTVGRSGDGGIDGIINEDALGLDAVYVQAKRYAQENTIGRPAIQQFVGSLIGQGATKGVFVTTSSFSRDAREFADRAPQRIILIDGDRLARLMIAHGVGVRAMQTVVIPEIDENFFAED